MSSTRVSPSLLNVRPVNINSPSVSESPVPTYLMSNNKPPPIITVKAKTKTTASIARHRVTHSQPHSPAIQHSATHTRTNSPLSPSVPSHVLEERLVEMDRELNMQRERDAARWAYEHNRTSTLTRTQPGRNKAKLIDRKQQVLASSQSPYQQNNRRAVMTHIQRQSKRIGIQTNSNQHTTVGRQKTGIQQRQQRVTQEQNTNQLEVPLNTPVGETERADKTHIIDEHQKSSHPPQPVDYSAALDKLVQTFSDESQHTMLLASTYVSNAQHFHSPAHREDLQSLLLYSHYRNPITRAVVFLVIILNMSLTYLEDLPGVQGGLSALEFFLLCILTAWTGLELYLYPHKTKLKRLAGWTRWSIPVSVPVGRHKWHKMQLGIWKDEWDQVKVLCLCVCFLDLILSAWCGAYEYRVVKPLRAYFLLTYSHDTRTQSKQLAFTIRKMLIPVLLVFFLVFIESAIALVFFHENEDMTQSGQGDNVDYFSSVFDSFFSLFVLLTTANFPDVSFAAINAHGLVASLFFILCLVVGLYITVNVLIAFVYSLWRERAVMEYWLKLKKREANLKNAFQLLTAGSVEQYKQDKDKQGKDKDKGKTKSREQPCLSLQTWTRLFVYMHPRLSYEDANVQARVFFLLLTTTSTEACSSQDFLDLCSHLESVSLSRSKDQLPTRTEKAMHIHSLFEHPFCQYFRSTLAVLDSLMCVYAFASASSTSDLFHPVWTFVLDCLYCVFMCGEIAGSIYVNQWSRFWCSPWKRASFLLVVASMTGKIFIEFLVQPILGNNSLNACFRAATFFRVIRVLRVPLLLKPLRLGLKSLCRVFAPLSELFISLVIIYYLWALLGMGLFSGCLSVDDHPELLSTPFVTSGYYLYFNFDDFGSALFTLFHFQAVTNFNYTISALILVTSQWAFLYYLFFWFVVSLCTLNLVIAYMIENIEIAVKNLRLSRADKDKDRKQRREAEQWAREMILSEQQNHNNTGTGTEEPAEASALPVSPSAPSTSGLVRTMTIAPTIEKKKKRVEVFEEDALKHKEDRDTSRTEEEMEYSVSNEHRKEEQDTHTETNTQGEQTDKTEREGGTAAAGPSPESPSPQLLLGSSGSSASVAESVESTGEEGNSRSVQPVAQPPADCVVSPSPLVQKDVISSHVPSVAGSTTESKQVADSPLPSSTSSISPSPSVAVSVQVVASPSPKSKDRSSSSPKTVKAARDEGKSQKTFLVQHSKRAGSGAASQRK